MTRRDMLREQIHTLQNELDSIDEAADLARACELVGTCYRYENASSKTDTWYLYTAVVAATNEGQIQTVEFQQTKPDGDCWIRRETRSTGAYSSPNYVKIPMNEWLKARMLFQIAVDKALSLGTN